jgi:hypothetical protein
MAAIVLPFTSALSRRELEASPHDLDPLSAHAIDAAGKQAAELGDVLGAQRGVRAHLPDDQVRLHGEHVAFEALEHLGHVLAADALVEDRDLDARPVLLQRAEQPAG